MRTRWSSGPRRRPRDDSGYTLIELLVAMGLFTFLIVIFMSGIVQMTRSTVRVQNVTGSADEARRAFTRMDRQLRYASAVNRPVRVGDDWYLEFQTTSTGTTTGACTQWRLVDSGNRLQYRTWPDTGSPTASSWTTVASDVANDPTAQPPFSFAAADSTYTRQRVTLFLHVTDGQPGSAEVRATFVARNTSTATVTNADATPADGVSDSQVCQQVGRS